jgi:hypothetical protein
MAPKGDPTEGVPANQNRPRSQPLVSLVFELEIKTENA